MAATYQSPAGSIVKWKGSNDASPFANDCAFNPDLCLPVIDNTDLSFIIDVVGDDIGDSNYAAYTTWKVFKCDDCGDSIGAQYSSPYAYTDGLTTHLVVTDFTNVTFAYIAVDTCFKMCLSATRPTVYRYLANSNPANGAIADAIYIGATRYNFAASVTCTGVAAVDWPLIAAQIMALELPGIIDTVYAGGQMLYFLSTGLTLILNITTVGIDITWTELAPIASFTETVACSNCFIKSDDDCFTTKLVYRSADNCFGFMYTDNAQMLAFENKVRVPMYFQNMQTESEENTFSKANGVTQMVSAVYKKTYEAITDLIYVEWLEAIALALKHDTVEATNGYAKFTDQQIVSTDAINLDYPFEPFMSVGTAKTKVTLTPYDQRNSNCG